MAETLRFLFTFLGKERNAPLTAMFLALCFMAWWNIRQETRHIAERGEHNARAMQIDSLNRKEREAFIVQIAELGREMAICREETERLRAAFERIEKRKR